MQNTIDKKGKQNDNLVVLKNTTNVVNVYGETKIRYNRRTM